MISRFHDPVSTASSTFSDVSADHWARSNIDLAATMGWIKGYGDGTFRPDNQITRAEAVTIINRVLVRNFDISYKDHTALTAFTDVPSSYWAYEDILETATSHDYSITNHVEHWNGIKK